MTDVSTMVPGGIPLGRPMSLGGITAIVDRVAEACAAFLLLAITGVVLASVIARYVFNASFAWGEELASWIFIWMIFVGMALGHRTGQHISVGMIEDFLPKTGVVAVRLLVDVLVAFTTIVLLFASMKLIAATTGISPGLRWAVYLKYYAIPFSCGLSLFYLAVRDGERVIANVAAIALGAALYLVWTTIETPPMIGISPSLIMAVTFLVTLLIGVPVGFALLLSVFLSTWGADLSPTPATVHTMTNGAGQFVLLAIPFFLAAGALMNFGGLSRRLIALAASLVGHFRGGLAQVNILQMVLLGGITGSSGADAATTTKIMVPEMIKRGYPPAFACAVTAVGSILTNIIPPSIALLVFATLAEASVARLFVAGILPGLFMAAVLMAATYVISSRRGYEPPQPFAGVRPVGVTLLHALPVLTLGIVIIGALRFGIATATEVGVIAMVWALILGKFVYRAFSWRQIYAEIVQCSIDSAIIGFLIGVSVPFAWVLIAEQIPQQMVTWALSFTDSKIGLLIMLNLVLLVLGTALEPIPAMLISIPIFLPLLTSVGVDPIHLGIIMVINLLLGSLTPPVGVLVFITASIARVNVNAVFRECVPLLGACLIGLLVLTLWPGLSLWLWNVLE